MLMVQCICQTGSLLTKVNVLHFKRKPQREPGA
jgi:hypothetical protein